MSTNGTPENDERRIIDHFAPFIDVIVSSTGIGLWDWNLVTGEVIYSEEWERVVGYEPGELPQTVDSWSNAVLPEDLEKTEEIIDRYLNGEGDHYEAEFRMLRKDGTIIWAQDKGTVTGWDESGKPTRLIGVLQDLTRIKNAEMMLKEKSSQLDFVAKISGLAAWDWNIPFGIIKFSADYLNMLGYKPEEVSGSYEEWLSFLHPDDAPLVLAALDDYLGGKTEQYSQEVRMRRKDGRYVWTLDTGRIAEWDEDGTPARVLGGHLNIDELKRVEHRLQEALRENEMYNERLKGEIKKVMSDLEEIQNNSQTMFDANPYVNLIFNDRFEITDCNPAAVKYFGFGSREDLLTNFLILIENSTAEDTSSGKRGKSLLECLRYTVRYGFMDFETTMNICGQVIPMNVTMKRIDQGGSFSIAVYQVDLRSIKKAQRELLKQDEMLRAVNRVASILMSSTLENFHESVQRSLEIVGKSTGADRMYIWKNEERGGELRTTQICEWSREAVEPQQGNEYTTDLPYDQIMPQWRSTLLLGRNINAVVRAMPPVDREHLLAQGVQSILVIPIFLRNTFWGFIGFDDCHSERLFTDMEQGILQSAGLLIAAAMLRNGMTENLIQAKEEALASARAKTAFLANMSHEIRTPMNAIIGMTNIARSTQDPKRIEESLSMIDSASRHLLGLINDVLDMSKIDAKKLDLAVRPFSLRELVRDIYNINIIRAREKEQTLSVAVDDTIPDGLIGDDMRIGQIVNNLMSNAVKFTKEGGRIGLILNALEAEPERMGIEIIVEDDGIGIEPEKVNTLFNAFEQADASISRKYGGTGLGLAITKSLVEHMGGTIRVESVFHQGSSFIVHLTLPVDRNAKPARKIRIEGGAVAESFDFGGKHILLAEDIEINQIIVSSYLEESGVEIDYAENGELAYEMFSANPERYDMIYMDIHMPVMDGYTATEKIRHSGIPRSAEIPIVAMTANAFAEDIERSRSAGMNDHIAKPIEPAALLRMTARYLAG